MKLRAAVHRSLHGTIFALCLIHLTAASPTPITEINIGNRNRLRRDDDDRYIWAALGDSFAAGPGAGQSVDPVDPNKCFRSEGSYPIQLNRNFPFGQNALDFLACTGHVTEDVVNTQLPDMEVDNELVTLSTGGNDIGFAKIVKACIFKPGGPLSDDCDMTIAASRVVLEGEDFRTNQRRVWDGIFEKLPKDYHYQVYQTLYDLFFESETDWCDTQTMGLWPGYKPLLDKDLRRKLNRLTEDVNDKIVDHANEYIRSKQGGLGQPHAPGWFRNRLFAARVDPAFNGHRFCEKDVEDPSCSDERIWFFTPFSSDTQRVAASTVAGGVDTATCKNDTRAARDQAFAYSCDIARFLEASGGQNNDVQIAAGAGTTQAFHPKTAGFTGITNIIGEVIGRLGYPREQNINSGILRCEGTHVDGDTVHYFTREGAISAIADFCQSLASSGLSLGLQEIIASDGRGGSLNIYAARDDNADPNCPPADFSTPESIEVCKARLGNAIDLCDVSIRQSDNWKQGGTFYRDCVTWKVTRPPWTSTTADP